MYVPQQQALYCGGKHGELCIFDLRQRLLRQNFKIFDHSDVRSMAMDPNGEFFSVGSSDGDVKVWKFEWLKLILIEIWIIEIWKSKISFKKIGKWIVNYLKVWSLGVPQLLHSFPGDHAAKGGFSLRNVGGVTAQGTQQLYIDSSQRLYSCGADCSVKLRQLPSLGHEYRVL